MFGSVGWYACSWVTRKLASERGRPGIPSPQHLKFKYLAYSKYCLYSIGAFRYKNQRLIYCSMSHNVFGTNSCFYSNLTSSSNFLQQNYFFDFPARFLKLLLWYFHLLSSSVTSIHVFGSADSCSHFLLPSHRSAPSFPFITVLSSLLLPVHFPLSTAHRVIPVLTSSFPPSLQSVLQQVHYSNRLILYYSFWTGGLVIDFNTSSTGMPYQP